MKQCYGSVSFSIFLNGESFNYFKSLRGLRQGDPLSPFLFLIVAEALGAMLAKAFQGDLLKGIPMARDGTIISHFQFAEDTLVICRGSMNQMCLLQCVIKCFELVSGLKVNLSKSRIFSMGQVLNIDIMAELLGCQVDSLPSTYLGLPLGHSFKRKDVWTPVFNRIQWR